MSLFLVLLISLILFYSPSRVLAQTCNYINPPNDAPNVSLRADGHTVDIVYTYIPPDSGNIFGQLARSTRLGFIPNSEGTLVSNQFGNYGSIVDTEVIGATQIKYYQAVADNSNQSILSNTAGIVEPILTSSTSNVCNRGTAGFYQMTINNAQVVSQSDTSLTFNLNYTVTPAGGGSCNSSLCPSTGCDSTGPAYLQVTRSSGTAWLTWANGTLQSSTCSRTCGGTYCSSSSYSRQYTIALPPNTSNTFTIASYTPSGCSNDFRGSATFSGGTTGGIASAPLAPSLNQPGSGFQQDGSGHPYVNLRWSQLQDGQQVKVYRKQGGGTPYTRWASAQSLTTTGSYENGSWVYRGTDDLAGLPAGTYYYGAWLDLSPITGTCAAEYVQTDQVGFVWTPPVCSGTISLSLDPTSVAPSASVTPTASGLNSCVGKTINFKQGDCTTGTAKTTCSSSWSGCSSAALTAPSTAGSYTYSTCVDQNGNGNTQDAGEAASATLTVVAPATPTHIVDGISCNVGPINDVLYVPAGAADVDPPHFNPDAFSVEQLAPFADCITARRSGTSGAGPSITTNLSCTPQGYTGNEFSISWSNSTNPGVTLVDIDTDINFAEPYYHKSVSGTSTTAPAGFGSYCQSQPSSTCPSSVPANLVFNPSTIYYIRTYNGTEQSLVKSYTTPSICLTPPTTSTSNVIKHTPPITPPAGQSATQRDIPF